MRKQTAEDLYKIWENQDALKGNISRMCLTDTHKELGNQYYYAILCLSNIYQVNYQRLTESEE